MKAIIKIAKAELQVLFYSPIAWLILVIFAIQAGIIYTGIYDAYVRSVSMGWRLPALTPNTFGGMRGLFSVIQGYLYLYIPLLTMGVMSRELASGSIKLLYSSPITNKQIVYGKYLALVMYALALVGVLGMYSLHSIISIENVEYKLIFTGLLGLFLLICSYAAIGLFMSSITSYPLVAAIGTFAILYVLNIAGGMYQELEFVRNITYWLSINGRASTFVAGMITSEDVLYFLVVIAMFVSFCVIRLRNGRQKTSFVSAFSRYASVVLVVVAVGYLSSMPKFKSYLDVTYTKANTLTEASQKVVAKLEGPLTIHTYVNLLDQYYYMGLPNQYMNNIKMFERYTRFKPEIKFKTHYYYHKGNYPYLEERFKDLNDKERIDTLTKLNNWKFEIPAYSELDGDPKLEDETFRFVRMLERPDGRREFLRIFNDMYVQPFESEISAAFKRITLDVLPTVGFVTGHGERSSSSLQDRGYRMIAQEKTFRYALVNQGYGFTDVSLDNPVPADVQILVLSEPRQPYTETQLANLSEYIERGGNMILASEPETKDHMEPITSMLGVSIMPGVLVKPSDKFQADLMIMQATQAGRDFSHHLDQMARNRFVLTMPGASGLQFDASKGFTATALFTSDSTGSWNELHTTNFIDDSVSVDAATEKEEAYPTVLALEREVNGRTQKILVTGDADWVSNGELGMSRNEVRQANYSLVSAAFFWLSDGEVPIDMRKEPPIDRNITTTPDGWKITGFGIKWGIPLFLALAGLLIWMRRRGR